MFKRLTILIVVAVVAYSAYWGWGAWTFKREYTTWFEDRAEEGWQAEYSALSLRGYPNRFDATWENVALADPDTGLAWQAPFFQLLMLSYQPNHVIAILPNTHTLSTPEGRIEIANDSLQASVVTTPSAGLELDRANLVAQTMTLRDRDDGVTALASLRAGIERLDGTEATYRIGGEADGLALSAPLMKRMGKSLPEAFETVRLRMEVAFDQPWGLSALEDQRPQPRAIDLDVAEVAWGPMQLRIAGKVDIDARGVPKGEVSIQARNWRDMVALAEATGALAPSVAQGLMEGLKLLAAMSGNDETIDVDLRLANGQTFLGIFPIGPAPRLTLR